jgi:hypothetical protein
LSRRRPSPSRSGSPSGTDPRPTLCGNEAISRCRGWLVALRDGARRPCQRFRVAEAREPWGRRALTRRLLTRMLRPDPTRPDPTRLEACAGGVRGGAAAEAIGLRCGTREKRLVAARRRLPARRPARSSRVFGVWSLRPPEVSGGSSSSRPNTVDLVVFRSGLGGEAEQAPHRPGRAVCTVSDGWWAGWRYRC